MYNIRLGSKLHVHQLSRKKALIESFSLNLLCYIRANPSANLYCKDKVAFNILAMFSFFAQVKQIYKLVASTPFFLKQ